MQIRDNHIRRTMVARCDRGEDLAACLDRLVKEHGVASGALQVIGALGAARLGIFEGGKYEWIEHEGALEIASCTGNVALKEGAPFVHAHAVLTDHRGTSIGGHVGGGCIVDPTAEIHLAVYDEPVARRFDEATGLWILDL